MSYNTKKKLMAALAGAWWYAFLDMLWYLPDVRMCEGLDWRIETALYLLTLLPAIFCTWLAWD
jgi:hypothetical protein